MPKRITFCALIMLALCAFVAVNKTNAQTVYGISGFDYDENTHQLYGYHATQLDYYAWLYYDAYVEGFIYDRFGNELDFDSDQTRAVWRKLTPRPPIHRAKLTM